MTYFDEITLSFLRKSQWSTEEEMYETRLRGLLDLLNQAKNHTKYYRNLPKITDLESVNKLPLLTKDMIHNNFDALTADNIQNKLKWTGGTSQVVNILSPLDQTSLYSGKQRFMEWQRCVPKREAVLWGLGELERDSGIKWMTIRGNVLYLPIEYLRTKEDAIRYLKAIIEFSPDKIRGYPSAMTTLAYYALEEEIKYQPKIIETNCEPLTPYKKELLQRAFNAPIFVFYGSQDLGSMAQDCYRHKGLHLFAERYILEKSEEGRFLWTDLLNYAMPLIRYENGDEGKFMETKCSCGRVLPMIHETIGRTLYFLLTENNEWLNMTELHEFAYWSIPDFLKFVDKHQVVQEEKGKATFTLKVWDINKKPDMTSLIQRFRNIGLDITIKWTIDSSDIQLSKSGKLISCITPFKPPWLGQETSFPELM